MKMNNDLAYFLGLWLAEGSCEQDIGRFTITCGDSDVGEFLKSGKVLGLVFKDSPRRPDQWRVTSKELLEMFRLLKIPLVKAPMKHIPEWVWAGQRDWACSLIAGMIDGDGYVSNERNKVGYTSASEQMARDMQLLLTNLGMISRLTSVVSRPTARVAVASTQWRVELLGENVSIFKKTIQLRIPRKQKLLDETSSELKSRNDTIPFQSSRIRALKGLMPGEKREHIAMAVGSTGKQGSGLGYAKLGDVMRECADFSGTPEYEHFAKLSSDRYYWDEVSGIEESEAQTYDFVIPDTHSFWSGGFISHNTPKAYNYLYSVYRLGQIEENRLSLQWESWQFPTITSPFIPKYEIEAARRDMDEKSFRQEFEASFETMSGRVYYPFDRNIHVGDYPFNPHLEIWIGQDFNIDPMSSVIMQPQENGDVWIVDEVMLFGSNTEETCGEIERRYWRHLNRITVYPDPASQNRQHARGETDLDIFREKGMKKLKYRRKHPFVADRVNAVNRMLRAADGVIRLRVDKRCKETINGLEQTIYIPGSRDVDKKMGVEHPTDALGYCIDLEFPMRKVQVGGMSR